MGVTVLRRSSLSQTRESPHCKWAASFCMSNLSIPWRERANRRDGRTELQVLPDFVQPVDTLVVTRIDRLARSLKDLQDIVHELKRCVRQSSRSTPAPPPATPSSTYGRDQATARAGRFGADCDCSPAWFELAVVSFDDVVQIPDLPVPCAPAFGLQFGESGRVGQRFAGVYDHRLFPMFQPSVPSGL